MKEMWESMDIIEQLIDNIPEGPLCRKDEASHKTS
jgi:NADH:ubiquinone oxidoreductase subunit D